MCGYTLAQFARWALNVSRQYVKQSPLSAKMTLKLKEKVEEAISELTLLARRGLVPRRQSQARCAGLRRALDAALLDPALPGLAAELELVSEFLASQTESVA